MKLRDVLATHRVFRDALQNHFDYFDEAFRRNVLASNRPYHLAAAAIHPSRMVLVAKDGRNIIGYAIGSVPKGGNGQIYWLFVNPDFRGQNLGLKLLSRIMAAMSAKGATEAILVTHTHAKYYARQGFKHVRTVRTGGQIGYVLKYKLEDHE